MSPLFWPLDELAGNAVDQARKRYDALTQSASSMLTAPVLLGHAQREFDRAVEPIMSGIRQIGQNVDETVSTARQRFDDATKGFDPTLGLGNMQAGYDPSTVRNPLGEMQVGTDRPYTPLTSPSRPAFGQAQDVLSGAAQMGRESGMSNIPVIGGAVTGALQGAANVAGGLAGSAQDIRSGNPAMGLAGTAQSTLNAFPDVARGASTEAQLPEQVFPQISPSTPVLGGLNSPREWAPIAAGFAQAPTALENAAMGVAGRVVRPLSGAIGRAIGRTPDLAGAPLGAVAGGVSGAMGGPEDQTWQERARRGAIGAVAGAVVGPTIIRSGKNLVDFSGTLNRLQRLGIAAGEDAGHFLDDDLVGEISRLQAMTQRRLESHQTITDQIGRLEQEMALRSETLNGPSIERPPSKGMWAGTGRLAERDFVEIADRSGLSPYTPQWYDAVDPATIRDYKANAASRQGPKPLTPRQQMTELRNQHRELTRQQKMLEGALSEDMNRTATLEDRAAKAGVAIPEQVPSEAATPVTDVVPSAQTAATPLPPVGQNYTRPLSDFSPVLYREASLEEASRYIPSKGNTFNTTFDRLYVANTPSLALGQGKSSSGIRLGFNSEGIRGQVNREMPSWQFIYDQGEAEFMIRHGTSQQIANNLVEINIAKEIRGSPGERTLLRNRLRELEEQGWTRTVNEDGSTIYRKPETSLSTETPEPVQPPRPAIRPDDPGATALARAEADEALAIRHDPNLTGIEKQRRIASIYDRRPDRTPEENGFLREQATGRIRPALPTQQAQADLASSLPPELEQRMQQAPPVPRTPAEPVGPPLSGYGAEQQQPVPGMGVAPQAPVSNPQATISPWAASTTPPIAPGGTIRPGETAQPRRGIQPPLLSQQEILDADRGPSMSPGAAATELPPTTAQTMEPLPKDVQDILAGPLVQPGSPKHKQVVAQFKQRASRLATTANKVRYGVNLLSGTASAAGDVATNSINIGRIYARTAIGAGFESIGERAGLIQREERATTFSELGGLNRGFRTGGAQALAEAWDVIMHGTAEPVATDVTGSLIRGKKGIPIELGYRIRLAADSFTTIVGESMASHALGFREADRAGLKRGSAAYDAYAADVTRRIQAEMNIATTTARGAGRRVEQGGIAQRLTNPSITGDKANIEDLAKEAFGMSKRMAFQQDVGYLGKLAQTTRQGGSPLGWIIPFFRTTQTIAAEGVTSHPVLGPAGTAIDLGKSLFGDVGPYAAEQGGRLRQGSVFTRSNTSAVLPASQRLAEASIGGMVAVAGAIAVANNMITGTGPADAAVRRRMMDEGWRPLSLKTSNGYIPIARILGPLAYPLSFGVAMQELVEKGGSINADTVRKFADSQIMQYGQSSGLQDFYNILNIMFTPDPQERWRTVDRIAASLGGQWMLGAGIARQISQLTDPTIADPRTIPERLMANYPQFVREAVGVNIPTRTNEIGEPLRRGPGEGNISTPLAEGDYAGAALAAPRSFLPLQSTQANPGIRRYAGSQSAEQDAEISAAINAVQNYLNHPEQYPGPSDRQWQLQGRFSGAENMASTQLRSQERARRRIRSAAYGQGGGGLPMPSFSAPTVP